MNEHVERARRFAALHVKGDPLVLYNAWDAGSARVIARAGAPAIATGSYSVAHAHGARDREDLSLELAVANLARIVDAVDLPVTIDLEAGYGTDGETVGRAVDQVVAAGAVGINLEDQVIAGEGLYAIDAQAERVRGARAAAEARGVPLYLNARTDIFLKTPADEHAESHAEAALERAAAYEEAGASGLFVPGIVDPALIETICAGTALPVNVMFTKNVPDTATLAGLGVARLSYGGWPWLRAMQKLEQEARTALDWRSGES